MKKYQMPLPSPTRLTKQFGFFDEFYHRDVQRVLERWWRKSSATEVYTMALFLARLSNFSALPKKLMPDEASEAYYAKQFLACYLRKPRMFVELISVIDCAKWRGKPRFVYEAVGMAERLVPATFRAKEALFFLELATQTSTLMQKKVSSEAAQEAWRSERTRRTDIHAKWKARFAEGQKKSREV